MALIATSSCPHCGHPAELRFRAADRNRRTSPETFAYDRCTACGLIFMAEDIEDLSAFYPAEYHQMPSEAEMQRIAGHERWRLDFVLPWVKSGRLVEIGPGWGVFALLARD